MYVNSSSNLFICLNSTTGSLIFFGFATTNSLFLLPLSALVLYVGFQRWRLQRSTSMITATSHVDLFTYHMVAMEISGLIGSDIYCFGIYIGNTWIMMLGFYNLSLIIPGQTFFHILTCMERYLAVVHPITYLGLRNKGGARIRNISIGCVWLLSLGWIGVIYFYIPNYPTGPFFSLCIFSLFVISFCSFSVLWALTRRSPGDRGGDRKRVDQSKKRAFHTIMTIMGVLLLKLAGFMVCLVMYNSLPLSSACLALSSAFWLSLPSSLVLPLLFLQRAGKCACCRHITESG